MWVTATRPTRPSASRPGRASMSSSPASVIGATRSSMPCASRSICHGTMLAWCSISRHQHGLARLQHAAAVAVGDQVDGPGAAAGEHDLLARGRVQQARRPCRAPPHRRPTCARSSSAGRDARWRTASPSHRHGVDDRARLLGRGGTVEKHQRLAVHALRQDREIRAYALHIEGRRQIGASRIGVHARAPSTRRRSPGPACTRARIVRPCRAPRPGRHAPGSRAPPRAGCRG